MKCRLDISEMVSFHSPWNSCAFDIDRGHLEVGADNARWGVGR